MEEKKIAPASIDAYISQFPDHIRQMLGELRGVIREAAPEAEEKISWQMPTFARHGNIIHFAAHQKHIGVYPGAMAIEVFRDELSGFEQTKGSIHLPLDKPIPRELITKIVRYNASENASRASGKKGPKSTPDRMTTKKETDR